MSHTGTTGLPNPGPYRPRLNQEGKGAWQILGVNAVSLIITPAARMLMRHETGGRQ